MRPEVGAPARVVSRSGAAAIVAVCGEIDISNAAQLRACLSACLSDGCADITLDMKDLSFLDASGLSVLAYFAKLTASHRGRLVIRTPPPLVHKVLDIGGLASLVDGNASDARAEPSTNAPLGRNGSRPPGEP